MLETTRVPLQDIILDKMLDDDGGRCLFSDHSKELKQKKKKVIRGRRVVYVEKRP